MLQRSLYKPESLLPLQTFFSSSLSFFTFCFIKIHIMSETFYFICSLHVFHDNIQAVKKRNYINSQCIFWAFGWSKASLEVIISSHHACFSLRSLSFYFKQYLHYSHSLLLLCDELKKKSKKVSQDILFNISANILFTFTCF